MLLESEMEVFCLSEEEKFKAQGLNDFLVSGTQAIGALSAGLLLNFFGWQIINLLCIPLLILVILVIFRADYHLKYN